MSDIATELNRIKAAKAQIRQSIINKGVPVANTVTIDGYASKIDQIETGSQYSFDIIATASSQKITFPHHFSAFSIDGFEEYTFSNTSTPVYGFCNSATLKHIYFDDSVHYIGYATFMKCTNLQNFTLPNSLTHILNNAFWGCSSITEVVIPASIQEIGDSAFFECSGLTSLTCKATTPPTFVDSTNITMDKSKIYLFSNGSVPTIYVPAASVSAYKTNASWSKYADYIQPIQ